MKGQLPPQFSSPEFREASREFTRGLFAVEGNKDIFSAAVSTCWRRYKQVDEYETLRQRLSDSARHKS